MLPEEPVVRCMVLPWLPLAELRGPDDLLLLREEELLLDPVLDRELAPFLSCVADFLPRLEVVDDCAMIEKFE